MSVNKSRKQSVLVLATLSLIILMAFSSCEKPVNLTSKKTESKLVIEAGLSDQKGDCLVKLTKSKIYGQSGGFETVSNAVVSIKDESGVVTSLTETAPGVYTHPQLAGSSGKTYSLTVVAEGKTYTASSTMPQLVLIDSIYFEMSQGEFPVLFAGVMFKDPPQKDNYYRFKQKVNGIRNQESIPLDGQDDNGKEIMQLLPFNASDSSSLIQPGSKVEVEMQCLEKIAYDFLYSFERNAYANLDNPVNPPTNISGNALGYFSAYAVSRKSATAH